MENYDLILIALTILALLVRKSKITVIAVSLSVPAAIVANSDLTPVTQSISIGLLYLLMARLFGLSVKQRFTEVGQFVQWFAFACAGLSFTKVFVFGVVNSELWHNLIQKQIESVFLLITTLLVSCLFLKDKSVGLHELARDIRYGVSWLRNLPSIRENGGRKS